MTVASTLPNGNIRLQSRTKRQTSDDSTVRWQSYAQLMRTHDEATVQGWKEEIDTLLVFAGLFSAVVTAFNIEAYKLLQNDPSQISILLLAQISQQLAQGGNLTNDSFTITPSSLLSTGQLASSASSQSIRINAMWFSSLVCALFSALIGILVKQWLREYMAGAALSSARHSVRLRQHRYEGLVAWHVPEIMAFLPILLELSLILFFVGLIDFLLALQATVAAIVTFLITIALVFYASTTIAPVLSGHSPFKSPQSWGLVRLREKIARFNLELPWSRSSDEHVALASPATSWGERDNVVTYGNRYELDLKAMTWIHDSFVDDTTQTSLILTLQDLNPHTASQLVFTVLARKLHLPPPALIELVRTRACSRVLRDAGTRFDRVLRKRIVDMLLTLLEIIPRDHDPTQIGPLDVLYALWEFCLGACLAVDQDPRLYQSILNGVAELLSEGEPFRLRRAALNLLYESTHAWTYLYCPAAIGNIISFARTCYLHHTPDMFMKASAVVLLLSPRLNWESRKDETMPHHRQQLHELQRDLARFLRQCNEDGTRYDAYDERSAGRLVGGLAGLREKDEGMVEAGLPGVLLEGVELGLLDLSQEERAVLGGLQERRRRSAGCVQTTPSSDAWSE